MDHTYKTSELCRMFNVTRETISNWVQEGKIRSARTAGGHLRFYKKDIEAFASSCRLNIKKHGPSSRRILIVDDQEDLLKVLRSLFEKRIPKIVVDVATNGLDAGIKISELLPDLVILDAMMPGIKGVEVLKTMKQDPRFKQIRVIGYTAYPEEAEKLLRAGANKAMVKLGRPDEFELLYKEAAALLKIKNA